MKIPFLVAAGLLPGQIANAAPALDPQASALLGRSIAFYKAQKSFQITAQETTTGGPVVSRKRHEIAVQWPLRARWKADSIDEKGVSKPYIRRLIDAMSSQSRARDGVPEYQRLGSDMDRGLALFRFFVDEPTSVAFPPSLMALVSGNNPAKLRFVSRLGLTKAREGGQKFDKITLVRRETGDTNPLVFEYFLAPTNHELRKFIVRRRIEKRDFVVVTQFSPLQPNWKGSQSATDAAIYNWKTLAVRGEKSPAPPPKAIVSVDPKARQLFARATKLYGGLQGLRLELSKGEDDYLGPATETVKLAFDAKGRLRLETPGGLNDLLVIDSKNRSTLKADVDFDDQGNEKPTLTFKTEPIEPEDAPSEMDAELEISEFELGPFAAWLRDENRLSADNVRIEVEVSELREFRAATLPTQVFEGQNCDIVRLTTRFDDKYTTTRGETTKQETFWFAPADGRLVRIQTRAQEAKQKPATSDWQVKTQEFNPQFDAQTFVFTPPPGAKRDK